MPIFRFFLVIINILLIFCTALIAFTNEDAMEISKSGMLAQKTALKITAENIANASTLKTESGKPYQKKYAIFQPSNNGVKIAAIQQSKEPFKLVYDPGNPLANERGFVELPNVNLSEEMAQMSVENMLYEANTTAYKNAKTMFQQSLEILK